MLEKNYFAFLDVLGFKEKVKKLEGQDSPDLSLIEFYTKDSKSYIEELLSVHEKKDIRFQIFSDSVMLYTKVDENIKNPDRLINLFIAIAKIQSYFTQKGFWVRGGVSIGNLYEDVTTNALVGSALIKAYELESMYAKTPRVIIGLEFYEMFLGRRNFTEHINNYLNQKGYANWVGTLVSEPITYPMSNNYVHMDNFAFIDFFNNYLTSKKAASWFLKASKIMTEEMYDSAKVYDKLIWLKMYFSSGASLSRDKYSKDINEFLIKSEIMLKRLS